jgi:hypothetical protein
MLNTLKTLPKAVATNPVSVAMQEAALNVFSANMNVLYVTRDEGRKVFCAVKDKAGDLAARNVKLLKTTAEAANDKVVEAWISVEKVLEERVMPVLDKVGLAAPAQHGVDLVGKGLNSLSAQVVELTRERKLAAKRVAKKPLVKKVVAKKTPARRAKLAA